MLVMDESCLGLEKEWFGVSKIQVLRKQIKM